MIIQIWDSDPGDFLRSWNHMIVNIAKFSKWRKFYEYFFQPQIGFLTRLKSATKMLLCIIFDMNILHSTFSKSTKTNYQKCPKCSQNFEKYLGLVCALRAISHYFFNKISNFHTLTLTLSQLPFYLFNTLFSLT